MSLRHDSSPSRLPRMGETRRRRSGTGLRWITLLLLVPLLAGVAEGQRHQDRPGALEAERAISQLLSPYCPGFMLEVCPSPDAAALRDTLYERAAQGASSDELVGWMLAEYGEEWRGVPQRSGAGLLAWVIPPLALLLGVGVVVGWLRTHRPERTGSVELEVPSPVSDADRERLAAALREWEAAAVEEEGA